MGLLNNENFTVRIRRGLRTNVQKLANYPVEGELGYTTDTKNLFVADTTTLQPVQTLNMAVCNLGEIIIKDDEVVYTF